MNMKLVVEGCTLQGTQSDVISILPASVLSQKVKCSGSKAYQTIAFTSTAGTYTGAGVLTGASVKALGNALPFVLEDAQVDIVLTNGSSPFDTKTSTISVSDCGQTKVKAV